ncbi:LolA family protein [Chitinophaga nivalis]|uniref:Outer membrane lipoprotein carrier protein LolA n=1 Tax=Chitinophaga nivalis TaxID=2991709 RepID=A0ABT3IQ01_9BACT|nr:outer membrane lipoprotein carrier protein LolA [Chitinophaga nivalis]MCW3464278.1 outer membrane lipoprotein carrier protein LolA [Chitinophaga nivalis]MCW3486031.1 outer membrane lipoprotein carrier protein LolA [Chitinophaga nivalis]
MMKKFVLTGLLLGGIVFGSTAQSKGTNDPKAKIVLDGVSSKFKSLKTVVANFILKVEGANNSVNDSKKGTVYLKGAKYKVTLPGQEIISDNKTSWTYAKDVNEVTINNVDQSGGAMTPAKLFTNFYDKDFLYRLEAESNEKGKVLQNIELTPTDKSKNIFKVIVSVDKKNQNIARMKVFEKNGNHYTYEITSFTPNSNLSDATFTFDAKKFPGVEVVDLR